MSAERWQLINDYEPSDDSKLWLAKLQQYIDDRREEIYGSNIDYVHFMERKETFHEEMRGTIRLVYSEKLFKWGNADL